MQLSFKQKNSRRLKSWVLVASILSFAQSAVAQDCSGETVLWQNAKFGMSKEQFKAAYPTNRLDFLPGCPAYIFTKFDKNALKKVGLVRAKTIEGCPSKIENYLSSIMGKPNVDERYQPRMFWMVIGSMKTKVDIWTTDCTLVALHQPAKGDKSFTLIYQLKSDSSKPMAW